jgi:hypothetical protein
LPDFVIELHVSQIAAQGALDMAEIIRAHLSCPERQANPA